MNSVATVKQERASRARRWCLRALTVVGGSIAASVAAWALTTATASAEHDSDENSWFSESRVVKVDTVVSDGEQAVRDGMHRVDDRVDGVKNALRTNNRPGPAEDDADKPGKPGREDADGADDADDAADASTSVGEAAGPLRPNEPMHPTAEGLAAVLDGLFALDYQHPDRGDFGLDGALDDSAHVEGHVEGLRDKLNNWFRPAADDVLPGIPGGIADGAAPMPMPAPSVPSPSGDSVSESPSLAAAVSEQAAPMLATAGGGIDRDADGFTASDVTDSPSDGSPLRLPAGAPAAPTAPANGGATGGHADGSPFAVTSGSGLALIAASATKAVSGAAVAPFEPGRQPGVTPD